MKKDKYKSLTLKDNIEIFISQCIDYDNKHHCFKYFVLGFSTATLIYNIVILILKLAIG